LSKDLLAELDYDKLISGLVQHNRNTPSNLVIRFEDDFILNFPSQKNFPLIHYDDQDKVKIERLVAEELLTDIAEVSVMKGSNPVSDFVASLLKGMMIGLEFNSKWIFSQLVKPLMNIAVHLNPLPEYRSTNEDKSWNSECCPEGGR